MPRRVAARSHVDPFRVMEVIAAADTIERQGGDVRHLEVGQPSTPAPAGARQAAARALEHEVMGYTPATGIQELRTALATHYRDRYGVEVDPAAIQPTMGASGGFVLAFLAAFEPGDRIAVTTPGYPCYRNVAAALGLEVVEIAVDETTGFNLTPELVVEHLPLDGVVIASPSNPTGTVLSADELAGLVEVCEVHDLRLVSDEIYHGLTFEQPATTALAHSDRVVVVNSFSKYWSMTGWRIGWMVLPEELRTPVERLSQNLFISPPTISQIAATAALGCDDELDGHVRRYRNNRDLLVAGLRATGLDRFAPPDGAFFVWADVSSITDDSAALSRRWLEELGVATTPGLDFDPARGASWIRFSFAGSPEEIATAMERLALRG